MTNQKYRTELQRVADLIALPECKGLTHRELIDKADTHHYTLTRANLVAFKGYSLDEAIAKVPMNRSRNSKRAAAKAKKEVNTRNKLSQLWGPTC